MSSSATSTSTPLFRLAIFGGALVAAVSIFTIYREWSRSKKKTDGDASETETATTDVDESNPDQDLDAAIAELDAAQRAEDEERRRLLDEQDMEYIISEQLDAEKDRKRAAEAEEKLHFQVLEESRRLADIEARRRKLSSLPSPPTGQGSHILDLTVMIPELENSPKKPQRVSRKWNADVDSLEDVLAWVETLALPEAGSHTIPLTFVLCSDFPRNRFAYSGTTERRTLKSLGLVGRVILHIEETLLDESS